MRRIICSSAGGPRTNDSHSVSFPDPPHLPPPAEYPSQKHRPPSPLAITNRPTTQPTESPPPLHRETSANSGPFFGAHDDDQDDDDDDDDDEDGAPRGPGFRRGPNSYNSPVTPRRASSRSASPAPPPLPTVPPPVSPCGGPPAGFSANGIMRRAARAGGGAAAGNDAPDDAAAVSSEAEAPPSPTSTAGGFEPTGKVRVWELGIGGRELGAGDATEGDR